MQVQPSTSGGGEGNEGTCLLNDTQKYNRCTSILPENICCMVTSQANILGWKKTDQASLQKNTLESNTALGTVRLQEKIMWHFSNPI